MNIDDLIDDRPSEGVFRVRRDVFRDPEIFELEMKHVFEGTWVFVGLESQIPRPHDFFTTHVGRQPVILMRDGDGQIGCFMNTCRHRGTIVCPFMSGNQKLHVCRYHGWTYDSSGRNVSVSQQRDGQYHVSFTSQDHNLLRAPRLESYRGLMFVSLSSDVAPLEQHLGDARAFIDLVVDQSPQGRLQFVPGSVTYTFDANWKLQFENGLDHYHFAPTHGSYIDLLQERAKTAPPSGVSASQKDENEPEGQGSFSFANGHAVIWSIRNVKRFGRPLDSDARYFDEVRTRVGSVRVKWMLRQRNLTIFPNLQIIDITSLQFRTWRPLAPDKTEMTSHCAAPAGETPEARRVRIRNYEDFFNPSGLASSDDNVMYEYSQAGYGVRADPWTQGYLRGLGGDRSGPVRYAEELGIEPMERTFGTLSAGGETCFHAGYREWRRLLQRAERTGAGG